MILEDSKTKDMLYSEEEEFGTDETWTWNSHVSRYTHITFQYICQKLCSSFLLSGRMLCRRVGYEMNCEKIRLYGSIIYNNFYLSIHSLSTQQYQSSIVYTLYQCQTGAITALPPTIITHTLKTPNSSKFICGLLFVHFISSHRVPLPCHA